MKTTVWYLLVICLIKVKEMVNYIFADSFTYQLKLWNSVETVKFGWICEIQLKLWNSVEMMKISWNDEIQLKLWYSVEIVKFSWKCEVWLNLWNPVEIVKFQSKLWILVQIVKFGQNCEIWSKLWNYTILDRPSFTDISLEHPNVNVGWMWLDCIS